MQQKFLKLEIKMNHFAFGVCEGHTLNRDLHVLKAI
jgi:hypothetical protein